MKKPTYTPYDGSAKPFTIGLIPLDIARWIEPDADLGRYLNKKDRLKRDRLGEIFMAEAETEAAQQETLDLLVTYLTEHHQTTYRRDGDIVTTASHTVDLRASSSPALLKAGSLIADDLVLMRRRQDGWHLVAGHVAFPSSWSLAEKFGRPMQAIHADVPGFGDGTRNAMLITRIFDNLAVTQPVQRFNWSVNITDELFLPKTKQQRAQFDTTVRLDTRFARVERQTLRKLPRSGDILFTIRVYVDPIAAIAGHSQTPRLAVSFAEQLEALDEHQTSYKGLTLQKAELIRQLRALAAVVSPA